MNTIEPSQVSLPTIKAGEIDFQNATLVISGTPKFVVPVPKFPDGGELLVYPEEHEQAGEPILGWDKQPIGEKGVVFWNAKDSCWQAAADDGTHVVIINQVSMRDATLLAGKFAELGGAGNITRARFKDFMAFAASIGLDDAYHSDLDYVRTKLTPVMESTAQLEYAGLTMGFMKRDDHAVALAVYKKEPFEFINVAGVTQEMPDGGVIVRLGDDIHAIQPDIFRQTYRLANDGKQVRDLAVDIGFPAERRVA